VSESTHQPRVAQHNPATDRVNQPGREEAVVRTAAEPITHERPEEWGWHGEMGRWGRIGGWVTVFVVLAFLFGNHRGRIEDVWIVGIALVMVIILVADIFRRRNAWRSR
jgi:hypothetical protein